MNPLYLAGHVATKAKFLLLDNQTAILTALGVTGTATTAVLSGRASFKAAEVLKEHEYDFTKREGTERPDGSADFDVRPTTKFEKVRVVWPLYIPPAVAGMTTIACIVAAHRLDAKRIAALAATSAISERALQEYKEKMVDRLSEREYTKVKDAVAEDRVKGHPIDSQVIVIGDGKVLCYDMYSDRYFQSSMQELQQAENHINYGIHSFNYASLTEFYDEIGLKPTSHSDSVGFNLDNACSLEFTSTLTTDGKACLAFNFRKPPTHGYDRLGF